MLVNGKWTADWHPLQAQDAQGRFLRQASQFRRWISAQGQKPPAGDEGFVAETGRYHLYVALTCPWASRALMARKLKGLDAAISVSVAEPAMTAQGWRFGDYPGANRDDVNGATYLHEIYTMADSTYTGRATVPLLWDKRRRTIVNNESADIVRMMNSGFGTLATDSVDLYPEDLSSEIDALNEQIYARLNNGVYRAGFATSQEAYQEAFWDVFDMLDALEDRLKDRTFVFGDRLTETDIRLFVTLIRFDVAYHGLFKCNLRRISDYPMLAAYLHRLLTFDEIAETVNIDHIKRGYYSIKALNPSGIVPLGPNRRCWACEGLKR